MTRLPSGTVTLLFTDVEGSTALVRKLGERYVDVLARHHRIVREAIGPGSEVSTEGDSFFLAFSSASAAIAAAVAVQRGLDREPWPAGVAVRVRIGIHTGQPAFGDESYVGLDVHRAARIAAAGHGGQVLLSASTEALVRNDLPDGVAIRDLGLHQLKDLADPERIYQLVIGGLDHGFPPLRSAAGLARTNLPDGLTSFVGRDREIGQLEELLPSRRLVTVVGTGGTGKTRLAIEAARRLVPRFDDGAWLVELATISDPQLVAGAVAKALGVRAEPGVATFDVVADFVRYKRLLLLLDNCEHLVGAVADLVDRILQEAPGLTVLATSREGLGLGGESILQLPSLDLPPPPPTTDERERDTAGWLELVSESEAVRLFVDRASAAVAEFRLTPENAPAIVEICRRLDGIPLAIELAAARVAHLSTTEIAARLGDRFRLLTGGRRTAVARQQTLQALIDWSWDLLTHDDRRLLRGLSVFAGGWTLDAAASVVGADPAADPFQTLDGLSRLVDRSLVQLAPSESTRYSMLETIRQYGRDRLAEAGEAAELRRRHLAWAGQLVAEAGSRLEGPSMVEALDLLDREADNVRTALDWAFEAELDTALRMCVDLAHYWRTRSVDEGVERLREAARLARSLPGLDGGADSDRLRLVSLVLAASAMSRAVGGAPSPTAVEDAEAAIDFARRAGDPVAVYTAQSALGTAMIFSGRGTGTVELAAEVIAAATRAADWFSVGMTEASLAQWAAVQGSGDTAREHIARATEAAQRSGNPSAMAFAALAGGRIAGLVGDLPGARRWLAEATARYSELGDARMALSARSELAHALRRAGALDEAVELYRETARGWQNAGNRGAIANQLESLAIIALAREQPERAARLLGAADGIRQAAGAARMPYERDEYEAAVRAVRARLERADGEEEMAAGARLSMDEAVRLGLEV